MNKNTLKQKAISLAEFEADLTKNERQFIESEKKYYQIAVTLKQKREKLGLTQEKLATMSKVPRTTIAKIESGSRNTTLQTIMMLAQAMGNSVELRLI